jgi:hypothetical protein
LQHFILYQKPRQFYIALPHHHRQALRRSAERLQLLGATRSKASAAERIARVCDFILATQPQWVKNLIVSPSDPSLDPFLKLADNLGELEVTIGERARPIVAEVRQRLRDAIASRERGDLPGSLTQLRSAMERLAAIASELDPEEGTLMRMVAQRFTEALKLGDKGAAKEAVNLMRHKSGDPKDEDNSKW